MIELMRGLPEGITGFEASGRVTGEDYRTVLAPVLATARRQGRRLRLLGRFGPSFEAFAPSAAWEDLRLGLRSMSLFEGCAIVADVGWIRRATDLARFLMPYPVQSFPSGSVVEAAAWLASLPRARGASHHLIESSGVLVVEIEGPLHAEDFEEIESTVDPWIERHGSLSGLVLHAREFPGWVGASALVRHFRFVRDHHREVHRIALAVDGHLSAILPRLAAQFVPAEIRKFGYDEIDAAIAWAALPQATGVAAGTSRGGAPRGAGSEEARSEMGDRQR